MWKFQKNESGAFEGWNDPGVQTFRSNKLKSLAREIVQNSIDAKLNNDKPALIEFRLEYFDRSMVPGLDELRDRLQAISDGDGEHEGQLQQAEIAEALACASLQKVPFLLISDSNTTGMPDSEDRNRSALHRYIKAVGSSGGSQDRAGSHGLGKAAPIATSPLRTIFVSTLWQEQSSINARYQGRTRLMSLADHEGVSSGIGFWGTNNYEAFHNIPDPLFEWLKRETSGTTLGVPGFTSGSNDWESVIAGYIASEFFAAVHRNTLAVTITNNTIPGRKTLVLNAKTLDDHKRFFDNRYIQEAISNASHDQNDVLNEAKHYYSCISGQQSDVIRETFDISGLGKVAIQLRVKDGLPRKLCLIRRNMKITDNLSAPRGRGGMWKQVPSKIRDFCGVVEVLSSEGERIIREMEPPKHNDLSIDNMPEKSQKQGKQIYQELSVALRAIIEKYASSEVAETRILSELSEYFYDDTEVDAEAATVTQETDPNGRIKIRLSDVIIKPAAPASPTEDAESTSSNHQAGGAQKGASNGGNNNTADGPGYGSGANGTGTKTQDLSRVQLKDQKIWKSKDASNQYEVILRAEDAFDGEISIAHLGMNGIEVAKIAKSNIGTVTDRGVLNITPADFKNNTIHAKIEFCTPPRGAFKVRAGAKS